MRLNRSLDTLINNGLTAQEAAELPSLVSGRALTTAVKQLTSDQFVHALGEGAGDVLAGLVPEQAVKVADATVLTPQLRAVLGEPDVVRRGDPNSAKVKALQGGLARLGLVNGWGADGDFGGGTQRLVSQYQAAKGLANTNGDIDKDTKDAMLADLEKIHAAGGVAVVKDASNVLGARRSQDAMIYLLLQGPKKWGSTVPTWECRTPDHASYRRDSGPVVRDALGQPMKVVQNRGGAGGWLCNILGMEAHRLGGHPAVLDPNSNEYPLAIGFHRYSPQYHGRHHQKALHHFDRTEVDLRGMSHAEKVAAVEELLKQAQPGDFVQVDHVGDTASDGGHTRLVFSVGKDQRVDDLNAHFGRSVVEPSREGAVNFFQAGSSSAQIKAQGAEQLNLANEEKIWLLRPLKTVDDVDQLADVSGYVSEKLPDLA